jgi:hypothetical protein
VATINSNVNNYVLTATGTADLLEGEPNMRFDGTLSYLSSYSGGSVSSNTAIITFASASGTSAIFDYYVSDGTNRRAGTVISVWDSVTSVFTDYSTPDIGTSTSGISLTTTTDGTNVSLNAVVTSGTWTVKVSGRVTF